MKIDKDIIKKIEEFNNSTDYTENMFLCQELIEYLRDCSIAISKTIVKEYIGYTKGQDPDYCIIIGKKTMFEALEIMRQYIGDNIDEDYGWWVKEVNFGTLTSLRQVAYLQKAIDELRTARNLNLGNDRVIADTITNWIKQANTLCISLINQTGLTEIAHCENIIFEKDLNLC